MQMFTAANDASLGGVWERDHAKPQPSCISYRFVNNCVHTKKTTMNLIPEIAPIHEDEYQSTDPNHLEVASAFNIAIFYFSQTVLISLVHLQDLSPAYTALPRSFFDALPSFSSPSSDSFQPGWLQKNERGFEEVCIVKK
ncbi:hypothetical protein TWF173_010106 [Orbilia oligospora]|nr:hypothetical protein TWF173_010106 [Orbilia oligospora]